MRKSRPCTICFLLEVYKLQARDLRRRGADRSAAALFLRASRLSRCGVFSDCLYYIRLFRVCQAYFQSFSNIFYSKQSIFAFGPRSVWGMPYSARIGTTGAARPPWWPSLTVGASDLGGLGLSGLGDGGVSASVLGALTATEEPVRALAAPLGDLGRSWGRGLALCVSSAEKRRLGGVRTQNKYLVFSIKIA